jgi:hypothetical protein
LLGIEEKHNIAVERKRERPQSDSSHESLERDRGDAKWSWNDSSTLRGGEDVERALGDYLNRYISPALGRVFESVFVSLAR